MNDITPYTHEFLSNDYPAKITITIPDMDNFTMVWPSATHLFQAMKTDDMSVAQKIFDAEDAEEARRIGDSITPHYGYDNATKLLYMKGIISKKFKQHPDLMDKLVATGEDIIISTNSHHDNFFGSCTCPDCINTKGHNHVGTALMGLRTAELFRRTMRKKHNKVFVDKLARWMKTK